MKVKIHFFLCICAALVHGCTEDNKGVPEITRPVKVFHILSQEDIFQRSFPGKVEASEKADLAFLVAGKIKEFPVKEGDRVKSGELIAKLDPKDFEIALEEARSKAELAKVQLNRTAELLKQGFTPQSKYDALKTAYDVALANLDTAKQNFEYSELRAPFDGEIAAKYVENFQTIQIKEPIAALYNRDNIDIDVQIPESLAIRFKKGRNLEIEAEFDSAPGTRYPVTIKEISSKANQDTQTYKLTLTMRAPKDLNIFPGMTTTIYLKVKRTADETKGHYKVPITAVFSDDQSKSYVWLIQPSTHILKKQTVKIDRLVKENAIVTEGLTPGMDIVAASAQFLRDGMKVRPHDKASE